jgi:hypothetical protein
MRNPRALLVGGAAVCAIAACNATNDPGMGQVSVYLTDAPLATVAGATVRISQVYLVGGVGEGHRFVVSDTPQDYDLLTLQNGVTALLGTASIPVGDYAQLRLVVDQATVTLAPGTTFSDGSPSQAATVPSGMATGIKVSFGGPVHIDPGQTSLVVDFDVSRNFVFTGDPSHPDGVLFTPLLHGAVAEAPAQAM